MYMLINASTKRYIFKLLRFNSKNLIVKRNKDILPHGKVIERKRLNNSGGKPKSNKLANPAVTNKLDIPNIRNKE